ncbi:MAG TPA: hypothetical protein VM364_17655 [Vicinamibacterales bacterium]|nr:hypothetical protein [Vicinamibacterales bacterium]
MRALRVCLPFAAVLPACALLGPREEVTGTWQFSDRQRTIQLSLQQDDDRITGTACEVAAGTYVIYRGAPVTGRHPHLTVTVTPESTGSCCPQQAGQRYSLKLEKRGDIVATDGSALRFTRGSDGRCSSGRVE